MKKIILSSLLLLAGLLTHQNLSAQSPTLSLTATTICFNSSSPGSNTCQAVVTGTTPGATNYLWQVVAIPGNSVFGTYSQLSGTSGTNVALSFPNCGTYSIACLAYNGASFLNVVASTTVYVICQNWLSATNSNICNATSQTLTAYPGWASGYSWTDGISTISTSSTAIVTLTANTCYTVTATYPGTGCTASAVVCASVSVPPTITVTSVSSNSNSCIGNSVSITASGAYYYTWYNSFGNIVGQNYGTFTSWPSQANTCYTVIGQSAVGCTNSAVYCYTSNLAPSINLLAPSPSATVCDGTPVTIGATGGINYTWTAYLAGPSNSTISNSSTVVVTPSSSYWNSYSVTATNSLGCISFTQITLYTNPTPSINISGSNNVCMGQSKTLSASSPGTYTWTDGTSIISTASAVVVTPTANTCYTLTGSAAGCTGSAVACVSVVTTPTITATSVQSNSNSCTGSSVALTATGANTYTWTSSAWGSYSTTGSSSIAWPYSNTCYTVTGETAPGCTATAVTCVTVQSGPTITLLSPSPSATVCAGTPVTIGASGAVSYTWTVNSTWPYPIISTSATAVVTPTSTSWNSYTVTATNSLGCVSYTHIELYVAAPASVTVIGNGNCSGQSRTLSINPPGNYTWTSGSTILTGNSIVVTPTATTCYNVVGTNVSSCPVNISACVTVSGNVVITTSASSNNPFNQFVACNGSGINLYAYGASTYTWQPGNHVGSYVFISPATATCYTITGTTSSGCIGTAVRCISIAPTPTLVISGNTSPICLGTPVNLTASGASSYYWSWYNNGTSTTTAASASFTPLAAGLYTWSVSGTNSSGCTTYLYGTSTVVPNPTISISGGGNICLGTSATLSATGANTYIWSNASTGSAIVVTPTGNTCYTVTGATTNGCVGTAVSCIIAQPATLTAGPASQTVCLGSSANLSASGAASYYWSTSSPASTLNVLPLTSTNYSVTGTYSNGCIGTNVLAVIVNTACSDVWPGDANSDGVVDNTDVFEIGLAYSNTGPARSPGGNSYTSQYATNWAGTVSSGKNKSNADCNGDGIVDNNDTLAIYNNYSLTHAFKTSGSTSSSPDIYISTDQIYANMGMWNKVDILLGDVTNQMNPIYGVAFDLNFDQSLIETNSAYILYTSSFLNSSNQNVEFKKTNFNIGKIYAASVRVDGVNENGYGKIGEFWFKVKTGLAEGTDLDIGITNSKKTDATGLINTLTTDGTVLTISSDVTGVKEINAIKNQIRFFPNPTSNQLTLQSSTSTKVNYTICDLSGREVLKGEFTNSKTVDLSSYASGSYIVRFESGSSTSYKKLVIEK